MKAITYGQKAEGFTTWDQFQKELGARLKSYLLIKATPSDLKLAKSLFKKGYTVADTLSFILLKH